MHIERNVSLKPYNTFGIDVPASHFVKITDLPTLREALQAPGLPPHFVLSGGSNLLLTGPLQALVLYIDTKGREIVSQTPEKAVVRAMAGENWHELVLWTLEQGFGGLENLALIPGKAGTAPVQNIGAYGVELKDVLLGLQAVEIATGQLKHFDREACRFGYRDSVFKQAEKGRYIIWSIDLELTRRTHAVRTGYGDIAGELQAAGVADPAPADVARAVMAIRRRKLPDPAELGNSGSFFKNPVIATAHYATLKEAFPDLPGYPQGDAGVKVPAGWLIDRLGFKGARRGDAGVHRNQALVLVNHGSATGAEIVALADEIRAAVRERFGIEIEPEVNII